MQTSTKISSYIQRAIVLWFLIVTGTPALPAAEAVRERRNFNRSWSFHKGDVQNGQLPTFDDGAWRRLNVPHDWSIEGPYSPEHAASTGFLPGGIGWYRKSFTLPVSLRGKMVSVEFDGVYRDSDVWINGHHLGNRPYGYSTFEYDLTPHLRYGEESNLIAVRVDRSEVADSRWYTGSGIYRHVWLNITEPVHVAHWGTFVTTPVIRDSDALVTIETKVENDGPASINVRLVTTITDPGGREVATVETVQPVERGVGQDYVQQVEVEAPRLWSLEDPTLYVAISKVYVETRLVDEYRTPFGIRTIRFHADKGFFLNGKPTKIKGMCLHHDLGALGAAFSEPALERRLRLLKQVGTNAIRPSHNPMAPEFYDLCDRLGLLVMDEAFDEWTHGKRKWVNARSGSKSEVHGYNEVFAEWAKRDLADMILRDRNHPSIIMWSIGNEIDIAGDPFTHPRGILGLEPGAPSANLMPPTARKLIAVVKELDTSRPVTLASSDINTSNATGLADMVPIIGYNYQEQFYDRDRQRYPDRIILGSENARDPGVWRPVALHDWILGQFIWTGTDYLGESWAYPDRGAEYGMIDYCGFMKRDGYLRQAIWTGKPMVYATAWGKEAGPEMMLDWLGTWDDRPVREHWNWQDDGRREIPVEVYSNCEAVELFLNGASLGEKQITDPAIPVLFWQVPNKPGVVEAVGKSDGEATARFQLRTAGKPTRIELLPSRTALRADGADLVHVEARVVDAAGIRVYRANHEISFTIEGDGELVAVNNADPIDMSPVQDSRRRAYQGRALAIVRSGQEPGRTVLKASSTDLATGTTTINVRR